MTESKSKTLASAMRRPLLAAAMAAGAIVPAVAPAPALAAFDAFLKLDGVVGESANDKFKDWIHVSEFEAGFSAAMAPRGIGGGGGAGKPSCGPLQLTKQVDLASPSLLLGVMSGKHYQKAELDLVRTGERSGIYLKYELQDVMVSSLGVAGDNGADSAPAEKVALNFAKLTVWYYPMSSEGKIVDPVGATISCP